MKSLVEQMSVYAAYHRNPVNKTIHRIAVPIIVLDVLGFLHVLPIGAVASWLPSVSWFVVAAALVFYARLSSALALGMALLVLPSMAGLDAALAALGALAFPALVAVFVITWTAQFIGHALEGEKPSFFADAQFLLIGPLWLLADAYRRLGVAPRALRRMA